jgi:hypothetical protein
MPTSPRQARARTGTSGQGCAVAAAPRASGQPAAPISRRLPAQSERTVVGSTLPCQSRVAAAPTADGASCLAGPRPNRARSGTKHSPARAQADSRRWPKSGAAAAADRQPRSRPRIAQPPASQANPLTLGTSVVVLVPPPSCRQYGRRDVAPQAVRPRAAAGAHLTATSPRGSRRYRGTLRMRWRTYRATRSFPLAYAVSHRIGRAYGGRAYQTCAARNRIVVMTCGYVDCLCGFVFVERPPRWSFADRSTGESMVGAGTAVSRPGAAGQAW